MRLRGAIYAHACPARGLHDCPTCWLARFVAAVLLAMATAFWTGCARSARPPVPDVAGDLERQVPRVDLLAARQMADEKLHAQATAYVLGKAQRRSMGIRVARRDP